MYVRGGKALRESQRSFLQYITGLASGGVCMYVCMCLCSLALSQAPEGVHRARTGRA